MFSQTRLVWIMLILRPAIFLDRDGVINVDHGYPHKLKYFAFMPDAETAIKRAHHKNIPIFIVTNQGGIGLGYFDITAMRQFHDHMLAQIADAGGHITDIAYCPHHPKSPDPVMRDCDCRKPKPGMILDLARRQVKLADGGADDISNRRITRTRRRHIRPLPIARPVGP